MSGHYESATACKRTRGNQIGENKLIASSSVNFLINIFLSSTAIYFDRTDSSPFSLALWLFVPIEYKK
jgi:hypothetical protein